MNFRDIDERYIDLIKSDERRYIDDHRYIQEEEVKGSKARFREEVVPYSYKPLFFTDEDVDNFKIIGEKILKIGDKVVDEYIRSQNFRDKFGFPKEIEELIIMDNGYDINVPISRLDIFYEGMDDFKFVELNTDGSSAMLEDNTFGEITLKTQAIKDLEDEYDFHYFELMDSWVEKSLEIYEGWDSPKKVENPNVAILDFVESATTLEFEEFKKAYERKGLKVKIVDPRDVEYIDGSLYDGDFKIDMIYRRLVTFEMIEQFDKVGEFVRAYKDRAVCTIGSLRSQLIHNKLIFKILHDSDTLDLMTEDEQEFIRNHVPHTGEFLGKEEVFNQVLNDKDKYIMKPSDMNVAQGVFVGRDLSQEEWRIKLEDAWDTDYIYQEFIDPYYRDFIMFDDDELKIEKLNAVVGIFMYKEEFAGLYSRIGKENVISSVTSYRAANIIVDKKGAVS